MKLISTLLLVATASLFSMSGTFAQSDSIVKKEITEEVLDETTDDWSDDTAEINGAMSQYLSAIKKSNK